MNYLQICYIFPQVMSIFCLLFWHLLSSQCFVAVYFVAQTAVEVSILWSFEECIKFQTINCKEKCYIMYMYIFILL